MEPLTIPARKNSPEVIFDPATRRFSISGFCHPENVTVFFEPIMSWLDHLLEEIKVSGDRKPILLVLYFKYFNSATFKYLFTFIPRFKDFEALGVPVSFEWYYEPGDEDMRQSCLDFFEFSNLDLPFQCLQAEQ